jgi:hypothetical protein
MNRSPKIRHKKLEKKNPNYKLKKAEKRVFKVPNRKIK